MKSKYLHVDPKRDAKWIMNTGYLIALQNLDRPGYERFKSHIDDAAGHGMMYAVTYLDRKPELTRTNVGYCIRWGVLNYMRQVLGIGSPRTERGAIPFTDFYAVEDGGTDPIDRVLTAGKDAGIVDLEDGWNFDAMIGELPDHQARCIRARYQTEQTYDAIAASEGITKEAVRSREATALKSLRRQLAAAA